MSGPLNGVRVIDVTQYVAGPYCSKLLADFGAEVIKVERPDRGDIYRVQGPYFIDGQSSSFLSLNRGKKSVTVNLKAESGRELMHRLVERADVFLENSRPGTMQRLGLDYAALREVNPRLIYCSISGYGQTGPYKDKGGYDLMAQGVGGIMSLTGEEGGRPVKVGVPVLDMGAAMWGALGILAAYIARADTGVGQHVDTSLFDCSIAWLTTVASNYFATGEVPPRMGTASPMFAPYQAFRTRDIYITVVGTGGKDSWGTLCGVLGLDHLVDDPRFATNAKRIENLNELTAIIEEVLMTQPGQYWLDKLDAAGLPCGPINTLDAVLEDPQVQARDLVVELEHPTIGKMNDIGMPVKMSAAADNIGEPPPLLGEDTDAVLSWLGYDAAAIQELRNAGVV